MGSPGQPVGSLRVARGQFQVSPDTHCGRPPMWAPENRRLVGAYGTGQALSDDQ